MFTGMELMACPNLAVPAEVMHHIVNVESGSNPFAIGIVGAQLTRQPRNLDEALATARMLDAKGYNFSLGVAQVNRANLGKYGLDSYEKAFETCPNLSAGARILAECYASANGDWGKSFSCYYSGNFVTGYRDGYVKKIYDSINRSAVSAGDSNSVQAIALQPRILPATTRSDTRDMAPMVSSSASYRVTIRSVALDTVAVISNSAIASVPAQASRETAQPQPDKGNALASTTTTAHRPASTPEATASDVFVPQVRGPNDPSAAASHVAAQPQTATSSTPTELSADQADLRQGNHDAAFVF